MDNENEALKKIGTKIYEARKKQGLNQRELAAKAGVDYRNLQRMEDGEGNPTFKTLAKIAHALGVKFHTLFY